MVQAVHDQALEIGRRWAEAELRADAETLNSLLDDDFICVGPLGFVLTKEQYLAPRRSGDMKYETFAWEDVTVRVYTATAIAVGSETQKAGYQGRDASGRFRVAQVLVRQGQGWVIASLHFSPIVQPPAEAGSARWLDREKEL
jgi:ketosteroid isomerase-like protein